MMITENLDFFSKFLILVAIILSLSYCAYEITRLPVNRRRKIKISLIGGVLLTAFTYFCLQDDTFLFTQEGVVSAKLNEIKKYGAEKLGFKQMSDIDTAFFENRFLFIDVAYNHDLIAVGMRGDSTNIVITDRAKLGRLFKFLSVNKERFGVLACDVTFGDATKFDSQLLSSLECLRNSEQLVMGYTNDLTTQNNGMYSAFDTFSLGNVEIPEKEKIYFTHQLKFPNDKYTFAYLLYCKLNKTDYYKEQATYHIFFNFITELNFTDRDIFSSKRDTGLAVDRERTFFKDSSLIYTVGRSLTENGQQAILRRLEKIRNKGEKPIIFIGDLSDEFNDVHETSLGKMHGSTILLNEYYYLVKKYHLLSEAKFYLYLATLLCGYSSIIFFMLTHALPDKHMQPRNHNVNNRSLKSWFSNTFQFIFAETYLVLILVLCLLLNIFFHRLINIAVLIYILPLFSVLLKYFGRTGHDN